MPYPPGQKHNRQERITEDIVKNTTDYLRTLNLKSKFHGTVLIAKDGVPVLMKACGFANRSGNVPNKIDTKYNIASMNKMFTAIAILQLVEKRNISLNDKIIKHLPDYQNKDVANKITIHQLLTHTSGLGHYWTRMFDKTPKEDLKSVADYLQFFVNRPLEIKPGSRFHYSNSGYVVLGLIIEKVTKQSYYDYVRKNIYRRAGMENTDSYEIDSSIPNMAIGYTIDKSKRKHLKSNRELLAKGNSAGGGYSTVEDLLKFSNALLGNKLLSEKYTQLAITGKVRMSDQVYYGYALIDEKRNNRRIIWLGGGYPGVSTNLQIYFDIGYIVIVLSNYDMGSVEVEDFIQKELIGK